MDLCQPQYLPSYFRQVTAAQNDGERHPELFLRQTFDVFRSSPFNSLVDSGDHKPDWKAESLKSESNHTFANLVFKRSKYSVCNNINQRPTASGSSQPNQPSEDRMATNQNFDYEVLDIVKRIRTKLFTFKHLNITDICRKMEYRESAKVNMDLISQVLESLPKIDDLEEPAFVDLCITNKITSKAIQTLLAQGDAATQATILTHCETSLDFLLHSKYGNFILQEATRCCPSFAADLERKLTPVLGSLVSLDGPSRVMQVLVLYRPQFRLSVLRWFLSQLETLQESVPLVFLLSSAIQATNHSKQEMKLLRGILFSPKSNNLRKFKFFKPLIASFIDKCTGRDLDKVFRFFNIGPQFDLLLNDRFGALVLDSLLIRGHEETISLMLTRLAGSLPSLITAKYFKALIHRLAYSQTSEDLKRSMLKELARGNPNGLKEVTSSTEKCYFITYIVSSLLTSEHQALLRRLKSELDQPRLLRKTLRSLTTFLL
jgi:hypothetical protein